MFVGFSPFSLCVCCCISVFVQPTASSSCEGTHGNGMTNAVFGHCHGGKFPVWISLRNISLRLVMQKQMVLLVLVLFG